MHEELIKDLRRNGLNYGTSLDRYMGLCDVAADAIEALATENAAKNAEIAYLKEVDRRAPLG